MPTVLPPSRETDHAIRLQNEARPVGVRPYRYLHIQKNEIERLVKEMLIVSNNNPVLLVKKKNGS